MKKKPILKNIFTRLFSILLLAICFVFSSPCFTSYAYELPEDLDNFDQVTLGVYDHVTDGVIQSDPMDIDQYFLYALSNGLYECFYSSGTGSVTASSIYTALSDYVSNNPTSAFALLKDASLTDWLFNASVVRADGSSGTTVTYDVVLYGIRVPFGATRPWIDYSVSASTPETYTWALKTGNGSSYFFVDTSQYTVAGTSYNTVNTFCFSPQLSVVEDFSYSNVQWNFGSTSGVNNNYFASVSDLSAFLADSSSRSLVYPFQVTISNDGNSFSLSYMSSNFSNYSYNSSWNIYSPTSGFAAVSYKMLNSGRAVYPYKVLYSSFPFYQSSGLVVRSNNDYYFKFPTQDYEFEISDLTPVYLSVYGDSSFWPTPTPLPDAQPINSSTFQDLGYIFTELIAHSYPITVEGVTFLLNPFYLFVACVLIGLTVRLFVGGTHE